MEIHKECSLAYQPLSLSLTHTKNEPEEEKKKKDIRVNVKSLKNILKVYYNVLHKN
jgi:hypothetical protein